MRIDNVLEKTSHIERAVKFRTISFEAPLYISDISEYICAYFVRLYTFVFVVHISVHMYIYVCVYL